MQFAVTPAWYQWQTACMFTAFLHVEIARAAVWCKNQSKPEPDLAKMVANWAAVFDFIDKLDHTPADIPQEQIKKLAADRIYTYEYMKTDVQECNGMIAAMENFATQRYQELLNRQLFLRLEEFRTRLVTVPDMDEYDFSDLYTDRDMLEYVLYAVDIIRLDWPRLVQIEFARFQTELEQLDHQFKNAVGGKVIPLPYAPETFWWRLT